MCREYKCIIEFSFEGDETSQGPVKDDIKILRLNTVSAISRAIHKAVMDGLSVENISTIKITKMAID